jgi:pimeloyl-ACP methyl ester carboxylesterase
MVGELSDLREHAPWRAEQISVPVLAGYGSTGRPHHRRGMEHVAATVAGAQAVSLEGCGHDAPMTHPALYAEALVVPLLR